MEDANIKLAAVATDSQGVSARAMLEALISGETDPAQLAELAKGRLRAKIPDLEQALSGRVREHHRFMWREVLEHINELNTRLLILNARIRDLTAPYESIIQRLDAIPGWIATRLRSSWPKSART